MRTLTEKMLTYALGRGLEYYDMPAVRKITRDAARQRLPRLVADPGRRQQSSLPDAETAVMIITKKALPRRTFLRGLGATLALPLLDAMVPAFSATVKGAGAAGLPARVRLRPERRRDERQHQLLDAERRRAPTSSCRRSCRRSRRIAIG